MNVKSAASLSTEQTFLDHPGKAFRHLHPVRITRRQCLGNMHGDIDTDFIQQCHWAHRHAEIEHGFIQFNDACACLEKISRLKQVGHQNAINEEAGTVLYQDRKFADLLDEAQAPLENFGRGLAGGHNLDKLHAMNRVEKVKA